MLGPPRRPPSWSPPRQTPPWAAPLGRRRGDRAPPAAAGATPAACRLAAVGCRPAPLLQSPARARARGPVRPRPARTAAPSPGGWGCMARRQERHLPPGAPRKVSSGKHLQALPCRGGPRLAAEQRPAGRRPPWRQRGRAVQLQALADGQGRALLRHSWVPRLQPAHACSQEVHWCKRAMITVPSTGMCMDEKNTLGCS